MSTPDDHSIPVRVQSRLREGFQIEVDDATSIRMAGIRQHGTAPELIVRGLVSMLEKRYRITNRDLPGSPDLANRSKRWAIFVHGCYWHRHGGCRLATTPKRNRPFWQAKFARNVERDRASLRTLKQQGFSALVVWECETRSPEKLLQRLAKWTGWEYDET